MFTILASLLLIQPEVVSGLDLASTLRLSSNVELFRFTCILVSCYEKLVVQVSLSKSRHLAGLLILLVVVGQAMAASAISCQMVTQSQSGHMTMDGMDHAVHIMNGDADASDLAPPPASDDCCAQDNNCTMVSCVSIVLSAAPQFDGVMISFQEFDQAQTWAVSQTHTSLYRPPIYR